MLGLDEGTMTAEGAGSTAAATGAAVSGGGGGGAGRAVSEAISGRALELTEPLLEPESLNETSATSASPTAPPPMANAPERRLTGGFVADSGAFVRACCTTGVAGRGRVVAGCECPLPLAVKIGTH
jgi:hypothetical protein